ncbi:MAG: hypothetical protein J6X53_07070, partial [Abditibacteriota bacterium]|nr:hypothetical protein [Abditibacteriota bacterium]
MKQISTLDAYIPDGTPKTVTINPDSEQTVTVYNAPKQTLTVRLYVKGTETPISGAKFLLRDSGGALVGENNGVFTTNDNGEFSIIGLTPGVTITATQTESVSGYVLDETPQSILIKSGNAQSLVFYNAPKGALVVKKLDAATEEPLAGAEFKILTISGTPVDDNEGKTSTKGIYRTDANGEITLLKLEPGVYEVTETKAPSGYVLDSEPQTVTVNADDRQTLTFRDNPLQSLTITKYEDGTTKPLAGVTFLITDANGNRVGNGEYTTDRNGQITITGLVPGTTVIAREVRTVKGYVLNGNPQTITIGNGANALTSGASAGSGTATGNALTFYDEPLSTLVIRKFIEGTDNAPLANVEFKITDGRGAKVGNGTYYTDKSGEIRVENLEPGMTVTVRETKTVSGYVLDGTPKTAEIPSGDVLEMAFWNAPQQTLTINKFVDGTTTPIKGVTFLVTDQRGAPVGEANGEFVTDDNGKIVIQNLAPGVTITAKETKAADGYALDSTPKSILIKSGAAQSLNFYNKPTGTLIVTKRDRATNQPLKGATFQIMTADGKYVPNAGGQLSSNGLYVTDDKGQIIITGLSADTLVVKETKAPDGYLLDDTPQTVKVGPNDTQTLTFYDDSKQTLTIQKFIEGTTKPIQGVTFLITDSNGKVVGSSNG